MTPDTRSGESHTPRNQSLDSLPHAAKEEMEGEVKQEKVSNEYGVRKNL
jgi:hypothetical protein